MIEDRRYVTFRAHVETAQIRTATFRGAEYVAVPVVAMVGDSIVRGMGSAGPEFVPAEELAVAPGGWNTKPVVTDHPTDPSGVPVPAGDPVVLEAIGFGMVFNSRFEDSRLKMEAWLDPTLAESVGELAEKALARCRAGELVEVSIGAWIVAEETAGEHNGEPYVAIWRQITPDHLALLPEGATGACSGEMGCGAPRVNQGFRDFGPGATAVLHGKEPIVSTGAAEKVSESIKRAALRAAEEDEVKHPILALLSSLFKSTPEPEFSEEARKMIREALRAAQEGTGLSELFSLIASALHAKEAGFEGVMEVYPDDSTVVYSTWTEPDGYRLWRRTYSESDGEVTLADDAEEVEANTEYKPVAAAAADSSEPSDPCPCPRQAMKGETPEGDPMSKTTQELVARLAANEAVPFDEDALKAMTEEQLQALEDAFTAEPEPEPAATEPTNPEPAAEPAELTEEQWLAAAPAGLRKAMESAQAAEEKHREALIETLGASQEVFTAEELGKKETDELERLCDLVQVDPPERDYSGRGEPGVSGDGIRKAPKPYTEALKRLKGDETDNAPAN